MMSKGKAWRVKGNSNSIQVKSTRGDKDLSRAKPVTTVKKPALAHHARAEVEAALPPAPQAPTLTILKLAAARPPQMSQVSTSTPSRRPSFSRRSS